MSEKEADAPTNMTSHLEGLLHVASLTNEELFPIVVAAIKRSESSKQKKKDKKKDGNKSHNNWQAIAIHVAIAAAKGEDGCFCQEDWVAKYQTLCNGTDDSQKVEEKLSFGEALKSLNTDECSKKRLQNALHEISKLSPSQYSDHVSIRQITGLIRTSTKLSKSDDDTIQLQAQAMNYLLRLMPQIESTRPSDMFLAVQLPILQKLSWDVFVGCDIKFTEASEAEFRSYLNIVFKTKDDSTAHAGNKRKRDDENNNGSSESRDNNGHCSNTLHLYLLEAAHLARNGIVRAKHGAIIFIPTENGSTKVIGRGWNHDFILDRSKHQKNKINLHSEVHAVVDAIRNHGEDECFEKLFPRATIIIVELASDYAYETCHPCPKCDPLLRAVGIPKVIHTTPNGQNTELNLGPGNANLLKNDNVSVAFKAACSEQQVTCKRLE